VTAHLPLALAILGVLLCQAPAPAADRVAIEDWSDVAVGSKGVPRGWTRQTWGSPAYDFTVVDNNGKALHLRSENDGSTITKDIRGNVKLAATPILSWRWKAVVLPEGGDSRRKETDDQAIQIYVAWPRFPEAVRSRIIGYVWDTTAPVGTVVKSRKTGTVTYVVVRSGPGELGRWLTERRNVVDDFKQIYGDAPDDPGAISIGIDSNDTQSRAESYVGEIRFQAE
jgi:hypothetical protein